MFKGKFFGKKNNNSVEGNDLSLKKSGSDVKEDSTTPKTGLNIKSNISSSYIAPTGSADLPKPAAFILQSADTSKQSGSTTKKPLILLKDLDKSIGKIEKDRASNSAQQFSSFFGKEKPSITINTALPTETQQPSSNNQDSAQSQQSWRAPDSWVVAPDGSNLDTMISGKSDSRIVKSRANSTFYSNLPHKIEQSGISPVSPILEDEGPSGAGSTDLFNTSMSNVVRSGNSKLRSSNASLSKGSEKLWKIRVFKKGLTKTANFKDSTFTFSILSMALDATTEELLQQLSKKYFITDAIKYAIFISKNGCEFSLRPKDKPVEMQIQFLENIGYSFEHDRLDKAGLEDHSYYFRFIFQEKSVFASEGDNKNMDDFNVDLSGKNLELLPVSLFVRTGMLESLNISKNIDLAYPFDFYQSCFSLKTLTMRWNELDNLPPAISTCPCLNELDASNNFFTEYSFSSLNQLKDLTKITLSNNLMENIPIEIFSLPRLSHLNLSNNFIREIPDKVKELQELIELDLSFNKIESISESIGELANLKTLVLTFNLLKQIPSSISKLAKLETLDIRSNKIVDLTPLSGAPKLKELLCEYNSITSVPATMRLDSILHWTLMKNSLAQFQWKSFSRSITQLNLSRCKLPVIPDEVFGYATQIEKLILDYNQFKQLPGNISSLSNLKLLSASNNDLNECNLNFDSLCNLSHLDLHSNNISELSASIWYCKKLKVLNLSSNLLKAFPSPSPLNGADAVTALHEDKALTNNTGTALAKDQYKLPSLPNLSSDPKPIDKNSLVFPLAISLKELYLAENRLVEEGLDSVYLLGNMEVLNLNLNDITEISQGLVKLINLEELYLSCNQLSSLPENVDALQKLRFLYLDYNKFGSLPPELANIKGLIILDVSWNNLKYNITNWPYDWNWNWNLELRVLDLSGNTKFELKPNVIRQNDPSLKGVNLTDFSCLNKLRVLDISDVRVLPTPLPTDRFDLRVRSCCYDTDPAVHGVAESIALTWEQTVTKVNSPETSTSTEMQKPSAPKRSRFSISAKDVSELMKQSAPQTVMVKTAAYKLSSWDLAIHNFMGHENEHLWGLFVGLGSQNFAKYLYDSFAFTFGSELKRDREDITNTMRRTFLNLTREYASVHPNEKLGAVGLVAFAFNNYLYVANVGDVGAVVSKNGTAVSVSSKHFCWDREENARVRGLSGSFDLQGNLMGETHVTRAFGFFHTLPAIAANPSIQKYELKKDNTDEFLILGCGTFWDNMPPQTAVDIARTEKANLSLAAKKLRDLVLSYGVKKSFTVMVVSLHPKLEKGKRADKDRNSKNRRSNDVNDKVLDRLNKEVAPPTKEVAVVFTDIKNSTFLWENYEEHMRASIQIHNMIMRRSLRLIGGYEVKTEGDAFMVAFPAVLPAVQFCVAVQCQLMEADWPSAILETDCCKEVNGPNGELVYRGISVRMGIHYGVPICDINPTTNRMDYFGTMVNRAARICGAADGGQIFVSMDVYESFHDSLDSETKIDEDPKFYDVGERKLKGLEMPEKLYSIYPGKYIGRHDAYLASLTTGSTSPLKPNAHSMDQLSQIPPSGSNEPLASNVPEESSISTQARDDTFNTEDSIVVEDELKPIRQFSYLGESKSRTENGAFTAEVRLSSIIDEEPGDSNSSDPSLVSNTSHGIVVSVENVQSLATLYYRIEASIASKLGISKSNSFVPDSTASSVNGAVSGKGSLRTSASGQMKHSSTKDIKKRLEPWLIFDSMANLSRLRDLTPVELNECFQDLVHRVEKLTSFLEVSEFCTDIEIFELLERAVLLHDASLLSSALSKAAAYKGNSLRSSRSHSSLSVAFPQLYKPPSK